MQFYLELMLHVPILPPLCYGSTDRWPSGKALARSEVTRVLVQQSFCQLTLLSPLANDVETIKNNEFGNYFVLYYIIRM